MLRYHIDVSPLDTRDAQNKPLPVAFSWLTIKDVNGCPVYNAIVPDDAIPAEIAVTIQRTTDCGHACAEAAHAAAQSS